MELELIKEKYDYYEEILSRTNQQEETAELIISDTMPDVKEILSVWSQAFVKETSAESGKAKITGTIVSSVLYVPENGKGVCSTSTEIGFTVKLDSEKISDICKLICIADISSAEAKMLNPRKLLIKNEVASRFRVFSPVTTELVSDIGGNEELGIHILKKEQELNVISEIYEKSFAISDEYSLPQTADPIGEIVKSSVKLSVTETKAVGSKLIFKGNAKVGITYTYGDNHELMYSEYNTVFSQIIEAKESDENTGYTIDLMPSDADIRIVEDGLSNTLYFEVEIGASAKCLSYDKLTVNYVADIYSTKYDLNCVQNDVHCGSNRIMSGFTESVKDQIDVSDTVARIINSEVFVGPVTVESKEEQSVLKTNAVLYVIYESGDGDLKGVKHKVEINTKAEDMGKDAFVTMTAENIYCSASGNTVEVRFPAEYEGTLSEECMIKGIAKVEVNDDRPIDIAEVPSVMLCRYRKGDSLWELSKKYFSTDELILTSNGCTDINELKEGELLLIPKAR